MSWFSKTFGLSQPRWFRLSWLLVVLSLCDWGAYHDVPIFLFGSLLGLFLQPLLVSLWCVFGRGPVLTRYSAGLSAVCLLWTIKAGFLAWPGNFDTSSAILLAAFLRDHFLLLPIGFLLVVLSNDRQTGFGDSIGPKSTFRFELRDLLLATAILAASLAMLRAFWLTGDLLPRESWRNLIRLEMIVLLVYPILQGMLLLPMIFQMWGVPWRFSPAWLFGALVAIILLAFVSTPAGFGVAILMGALTLLEFWLILGALWFVCGAPEPMPRTSRTDAIATDRC